jgi:hypothetical protein
MKLLQLLLFISISANLLAQTPIINELDSDTESVDTKEFIEIKTSTPFESLDGYLLVLFNGSTSGGDASYYNLDLDGFTTDINGLFVLGAADVSPIADFLLPENTIQNGADAVALYQANESDMPIGTVATTVNLIDALVYDTNDSDDTTLMNLLGVTIQMNEGDNGNKDFQSIQRANDGAWYVGPPTPKQLNDGSGVILNEISITVNQNVYNEGETLGITLTTSNALSTDTTFNLSLSNDSFNAQDYTGSTQITISSGSTTGQTSITLLNDGVPEEDEFMKISFQNLPPEFLEANNNVEIVVIDANFTTSNFGTPLNPSFGNVNSTAPNNYYNPVEGLAGNALIQGLQDIIAEEFVVRAHTYADVIEILKRADQNPANNNQVWLVYSEEARGKYLFQTGSSGTGKWNREHTFPRSRGGFFSIEDDDIPTGINNWWETNADSLRHANSDAHGLKAVDALENSLRGNKHYGDYNGPSGNAGSFKGDVARAIFYLSIRYNGLDVVNGYPDVTGQLGDLATLLTWHQQDPPDDYEMNRNNIIYTWQNNRNPFIDYPNLVDFIWGNEFGNPWSQNLSNTNFELATVSVYPNPVTDGKLYLSGLDSTNTYTLDLYDISGKRIWTTTPQHNNQVNIDATSGFYLLHITTKESTIVKRIIIR